MIVISREFLNLLLLIYCNGKVGDFGVDFRVVQAGTEQHSVSMQEAGV